MNLTRIVLLAGLSVALLHGAAAAGEPPVTLRYAFKAGGTWIAKSDWSIDNESSGSRYQGTVKTVDRLSVAPAAVGNFLLTRECLACDANIGDAVDVNEIGILKKGQKAITEMSATGRVVRSVAKPFDIYQEVLCVSLPDAPVTVGGTWPFSEEMDIPHVGRMEMKGDWKLVEIRPAASGRQAYLEYKGRMHDRSRDANCSNDFKFVLDLDDGSPVKFKIQNRMEFKWQGRTNIRSNVTCESTVGREVAPAPAAPAKPDW